MRRKSILIVILALLSSHVVFTQTQAIWPTKGWEKSSPEKQKMDISLLSALHEKIKKGDYGYVDGMHIFKNGYLVYEKYYQHDYVKINQGRDKSPGMYNYYNPDWHPFYKGSQLHTLQSVTKSVTSVLIGIAINRGEIPGVEAKVLDFFKKRVAPAPHSRSARWRSLGASSQKLVFFASLYRILVKRKKF